MRVPANLTTLPLRIKESMKHVPIFRSYLSKQISPSKGLTYDALQSELGEIGKRFGFEEPLKPYNFRRGLANALHGSLGADDYNRRVQHTGAVYRKFYQSQTCNLDVQSLLCGEDPKVDPLQKFGAMSLHRDALASDNLSYAENQMILEIPEYIALRAEELRLRDCESKGSETHKAWKLAANKRKTFYRTAHDRAAKEKWRAHFQNLGLGEVTQIPRGATKGDKFEQHIRLYQIERHNITMAFFSDKQPSTGIPDRKLLENLQKLCDPAPYSLYYPNESPTNDSCPMCQTPLEK
jgi:hypothetical protein